MQLLLAASLLQLRGEDPVVNPHVDEHGNVLCFNGEIFQGPEAICSAHANDGSALLKALAAAKPSGED